MDFRALIIFCIAFLVVSASGASLSKYGAEDNKAAVPEFTVKVRSGEKEIDEKITVNTEEETETLHITNDSDSGDVDIIHDFKRNLSLFRILNKNACFLSNSTGIQTKPVDLLQQLQSEAQQGPIQVKDQRSTSYVLGSSVHDRSFLSDEMAAMCDKYPIYSIEPEEEIVSVGTHEQAIAKHRRKRMPCDVVIITRCCFICIVFAL